MHKSRVQHNGYIIRIMENDCEVRDTLYTIEMNTNPEK